MAHAWQTLPSLAASQQSSEGGGYPFFCTGQSHDGDRKTGQAQAWLELRRAANTSESEKGGPGQQQHSFEFLLITFSHNFMVENSSTLPSYPLSFLPWSPGLPSSFTSLLLTKQNMKIFHPSRVTLIMTCPLSGPQKQPPGTPRTPKSQQKSKAPPPQNQLSFLPSFLPRGLPLLLKYLCYFSCSSPALQHHSPLLLHSHFTVSPVCCPKVLTTALLPIPPQTRHRPLLAETWCILTQIPDLKPLVVRGTGVVG